MGHPSSDCPHTRRPGRPGCPCRARGSCRTREPTVPGSGRRRGECGGRLGRAVLEQPVVETGRIGALGRLLGEATEDQSLEPLADPRSPLPGYRPRTLSHQRDCGPPHRLPSPALLWTSAVRHPRLVRSRPGLGSRHPAPAGLTAPRRPPLLVAKGVGRPGERPASSSAESLP